MKTAGAELHYNSGYKVTLPFGNFLKPQTLDESGEQRKRRGQ
jgi:hypothetical protein